MCSVDMSCGLMSCSMDRSKMHVQRRHSVRENVCTITTVYTLKHVPTCMCSVDMSCGLMSCSMDRSKMHVQRRHSVRENVCTIIIREHYCFLHMNNSVCVCLCDELMPAHTCAHTCIVRYMALYTIVWRIFLCTIYTLMCSVLACSCAMCELKVV